MNSREEKLYLLQDDFDISYHRHGVRQKSFGYNRYIYRYLNSSSEKILTSSDSGPMILIVFYVWYTLSSGSTITLDADFVQYDKSKDADDVHAKMSRNNYKKGKIILTLFGIFFIVLFAYYTIAGNSPRASSEPWSYLLGDITLFLPHLSYEFI